MPNKEPSVKVEAPVKEIKEASESLISYRDYLLNIFTYNPALEKYNVAIDEYGVIENRFHQDFATTDLSLVSVNGLMIPIVREILTSNPDNAYGFGKKPGSLPSRAGMSDRNYLDKLIALSGLTAHEMGLRYRLDLERPDSILSCKVSENIATLQGFYRDGFQDMQEPNPIYPPDKSDRAPFFLQYDEWLRYNAPFYGENFYNAKHPFLIDVLDQERYILKGWSNDSAAKWLLKLLEIQDKMTAGHKAYNLGQYGIARTSYQAAGLLAEEAVGEGVPPGGWGHDGYPFTTETELVKRLSSDLKNVKNRSIKNMPELSLFEDTFVSQPNHNEPQYPFEFGDWLVEACEGLQFGLLHLMIYQIPLCLGDCAMAMGDYEDAVRQYGNFSQLSLGHAIAEDFMGYDFQVSGTHEPYGVYAEDVYNWGIPNLLFKRGGLPYTVSHDGQVRTWIGYEYPETALEKHQGTESWGSAITKIIVPNFTNSMEVRFYRLRLANALLEWADALYRTNEPGNLARARELYKGVYWVYRLNPPIFPAWPIDPHDTPMFVPKYNNPAICSQLLRAQRGFEQIEAGLNYYGCSEEMVPALRYSTLKEAADHFAVAAQSAQKDFLAYMGNIEKILEQTLRDDLINTNMLKKAVLQGQIADEEVKKAQAAVEQAKQQVKAIEEAIVAKKNEIEEDDSFWGQVTDFCEGFMNSVEDLPGEITDAADYLEESGVTTGTMVGFGIFVYAGYSSISSMCDEDNRLRNDLNILTNQTLPRAQAQVEAKEHDVNIANLYKLIAKADADLARSLSAALNEFQRDRFLNSEFWGTLSALMKRVMRRYIELGARYAWLAERALAYEQDRPIHIVRFDYFPTQLQGVSGADLLQMDLNEMEATRLDNLKQTVPVKRIYSLLQDFPLAYGQFKKTGRCTFRTEEKPFQLAYPGLYGYRIRAVNLEAMSTTPTSKPRGLLVNQGFSMVSRSDGTSHACVRFPESAPFSDFRLRDDMAVYGLPDEGLYNFEGSGIETFWDLEFAPQANSFGLDKVADVLITFDLRANYSPALHKKHLETQPKDVHRMELVSARKFQKEALEELLKGDTTTTLAFNLADLGLPKMESDKKIANLIVLMPGCESATIHAKLHWGSAQTLAAFELVGGMAFSKFKPLVNSNVGPSQLDELIGKDVEQTIELIIDPAENPGVDFSKISDVILGVEYTAHY